MRKNWNCTPSASGSYGRQAIWPAGKNLSSVHEIFKILHAELISFQQKLWVHGPHTSYMWPSLQKPSLLAKFTSCVSFYHNWVTWYFSPWNLSALHIATCSKRACDKFNCEGILQVLKPLKSKFPVKIHVPLGRFHRDSHIVSYIYCPQNDIKHDIISVVYILITTTFKITESLYSIHN